MTIDWTPWIDFVRRHDRFLLTTHVRPDGDGLGSMLALAEILQSNGKQVEMAVASSFPERYRFLDPANRVISFKLPGPDYHHIQAVIILDTGTWNQLGDLGTLLKEWPVPRLVIDHHLTQDELGGIRLVDTSAEATGRLVYEAIEALGLELTANAAQLLFVALAMDTGWFRHANTSSRTFSLASRLMDLGAGPTRAYQDLFEENSLGKMHLMGIVLQRLQLAHGGKTCFTEIRKEDYTATSSVPQDSEDLINYTRMVSGAEVGLMFLEQPAGGVKISFRSRSINVARIAEVLGGGGHKLASGATWSGSLHEARVRVLSLVEESFALTS
ncbi:MAG: DHH family phosphoesterase [Gemmataceae bacterium]